MPQLTHSLQTALSFALCLSSGWLIGCTPQDEVRIPWQTIQGRDRTLTRPLYRVRVPLDWVRVDPASEVDLSDTTLPIATFYLNEATPPIRITLHTFPYNSIKERIPPQAQVTRWKQQAGNPHTITSVAHGGFHGLFFESADCLAWSMKIGDPYEQLFQRLTSNSFTRALHADYTIKAVGSPHLIEEHRDALIAFARSFEWIEEMPHP